MFATTNVGKVDIINGDYYVFLKKVGYATNPRYIEDLKAIKLDKK